jgi:hypothetical protein
MMHKVRALLFDTATTKPSVHQKEVKSARLIRQDTEAISCMLKCVTTAAKRFHIGIQVGKITFG